MAVDMFLKIEGVPGESEDAKHKDEIQIESFSWGLSQDTAASAAGGGGGAGKVQFQDFHFTTRVNKASPMLMLACSNGRHFPAAVLTCRKSGEEQLEFLEYKLTDVVVTSYQTGGSAGELLPTDQFSLNFTKLAVTYTPQDPTGKPGTPVSAEISRRG